jgi:hypothetical protein
MRTKTLLLAAALTVAGIASIQAQSNVYSLNVVGYYNLVVPGKAGGNVNNLRILGKSLTTSAATLSGSMSGTVSGSTVALTWSGSGFVPHDVDGGVFENDIAFNVGDAAFIVNNENTPITITVVGEVPQGNLSKPINAQTYQLLGSLVPQEGLVKTLLQYPAVLNNQVLKWKSNVGPALSDKGYLPFTLVAASPDEWESPAGEPEGEPSVKVGEGFFSVKAAATTWTRTFNVQ